MFLGSHLQLTPAIPLQVGRRRDVAQETAPFHERALNIAMTQQIRGDSVTSAWILDQLANHFCRARAVMDRHAHFQITRMIRAFVDRLAKGAESPRQAGILARKTRTGTDVGQIKNQIVDRIRFVLESRRDGEPFAGLEKAEDNSAPGGCPVRLDQPESPPGERRRGDDLDGLIVLQFRTTAADERQSLALRWINESPA